MRTARDRAESAAVARSAFLASMSHEIRTPMTAILGYADLLLERTAESREQREYVETIRSSGEHLLGLLDDVLDLSKLEAGQVSVESIDFDCVALAEEVVRLFRPRAESKGLSIGVDAQEESIVVRTDPTRVRQVLMNLVGNAIKFTDRGGIGIRVERGETIGPRSMVRISVVDSGIGMSREQQAQIFEPFRQGSTCTTRRYGGTGLGLAICRRLADLLAGDLRVESTIDKGSTFVLEILPEAGDPASVEQPRPAARKPADEPRLSGRVLLVEDAAVNRRLFRTLLDRLGLEVAEATDGAEGVEAADEARRDGRPFRLILMDLEMPIMDGLDATRRIRARGHTAPIVALTAHAMAGDRERCLEAGCDDYLAKPVDRQRLRDTCAAWLETPPLRASA
jgi:CheY-like chemotaxis protein